ncbi:MAG: permease [Candidatus Omnitrophica bacterium]|nr:permease [Candidatus Omnitrophota bacterium]
MHHPEHPSSACCQTSKKRRFWTDKTFITVCVVALLIGASYFVTALETFRSTFFLYVSRIGLLIVLGLVIGGMVEHFIPQEYFSRMLARKKKRTVGLSVLLGFLMSVCSHGIIALAIELHRKGASTPVVVSFLLASPWANLPITFILFGFFGLKALYIILGALAIAFTTGVAFQFLEEKGLVEANKNTVQVSENFSIVQDMARRIRDYRLTRERVWEDIRGIGKGTVALADMVLWWILIGITLSGLMAAFIPSTFFHQFMGPSIGGLFATLGLATILEVCSEGTTPLAFEIYRQTHAYGNAFVFLMAGVVTDYTEIGLIWANVGRKTALWIPIIAIPQTLLLGYIANQLF